MLTAGDAGGKGIMRHTLIWYGGAHQRFAVLMMLYGLLPVRSSWHCGMRRTSSRLQQRANGPKTCTPSRLCCCLCLCPLHSTVGMQVKAIYVGNLPETVTEEKLRDIFKAYGEVGAASSSSTAAKDGSCSSLPRRQPCGALHPCLTTCLHSHLKERRCLVANQDCTLKPHCTPPLSHTQ